MTHSVLTFVNCGCK